MDTATTFIVAESADATNLLIERGSTANGEMQYGPELGQDRAFILWTDLLTPHFVTVTLNSPAADDLGQGSATAATHCGALERGRD
jgi:type IV secretion system protein VirB10